MINARMPLSVGASSVQRAFGVVFGLLFAAGGAAFVVLPALADGWVSGTFGAQQQCTVLDGSDVPSDSWPPELENCLVDESWWPIDGFAPGPFALMGVCGIPFVLLGLYLALHAWRTAAWLDGTTATVRGALLTRSVDLATAEVAASTNAVRRNQGELHGRVERRPTIVARDPGSGRKITIPLRGPGEATLPPPELRALADAMTQGRANVGRDADVQVLAGQLRTLAQNPLGL